MMQSTWKIGRIGPLAISMHYTWLLAITLELWWAGLSWLPANFAARSSFFYWLMAVLIVALSILSVVLHELVHTYVGRTGRRAVNLFPFGAAAPLGERRIGATRLLAGALAAPAFSLMLGALFWWLGNAAYSAGGALQGSAALLIPLGLVNLLLGAVNLLPGLPFDGGWVVIAVARWFSTDRQAGTTAARNLGVLASIALVLAGAWRGLTSSSWLEAVALVLAGWAAHEAAMLGEQRGLVRGALEELQAHHVMEPTGPADAVYTSESVADMVRNHPHYPPQLPLPLVTEAGELTGLLRVASADTLLQGNWPNTPATALATPLSEVRSVRPDSSLNEVLAVARGYAGEAEEEDYVPVIDGGRLVGSIKLAKLAVFQEMGEAFGVASTVGPTTSNVRRAYAAPTVSWPRTASRAISAAILVGVLVTLGSLALRGEAGDIPAITAETSQAQITFDHFSPTADSIVPLGPVVISLQVNGGEVISSTAVTLDGRPLNADVAAAGVMTRTLRAELPGLTLGLHRVEAVATAHDGSEERARWQFRVSSAEAVATAETQAGGPGTPGTPGTRNPVTIEGYEPAWGGLVPAEKTSVPVGLVIGSTSPPRSARMLVDGREIKAAVDAIEGAGLFRIHGLADGVKVGRHQVLVEVVSDGGSTHSVAWTFSSIVPDAQHVYFADSGYFLTEPFLTYWKERGGISVFGLPISYRLQEKSKETGETYTAQYFERARFELHPSTGDQVILGRVGAILHPLERPAAPIKGARFFPETGHNLSGPFLQFWSSHGGLAVFGFPIGKVVTEKSPVDGKEYKVQYFERARFELHPDKAGTPYEVQLGLLGSEFYRQRYGAVGAGK